MGTQAEGCNTTEHICFVAPGIYPVIANAGPKFIGGSEIQQHLIAKKLVRAGYRVTIVTSDYGQKNYEKYGGIEVVKGPLGFLGGNKLRFLVDIPRLIKLLLKIGADVYVARNPPLLMFPLALHRKLSGSLLVKMMAIDRDCQMSGTDITSRICRWSLKYVDRTTFQSERQKGFAADFLGLAGEVVPNLSHDLPEKMPKDTEKDFDALWVGMFSATKRADIFLRIAEALPENVFCLIAKTTCPPQFMPIRQAAIDAINVTYPGYVPLEETTGYFNRAKMLVCTSAAEGFPNTFLQAWQAGIPIVSLGIDPDNVIEKNGLGIVCTEPDELVSAVEGLLGDETLRRECGEKARAYVKRYHSPNVIMPKLINVFFDK